MADLRHPFEWFDGEGMVETEAHPLLIALRDAVKHERNGHILAVETIMQVLDGMPVEVDTEVRALIKRRLVDAGWAGAAVDALFVNPHWRAALAGIEAAYAVAIEQARAVARQAAKETRHD